jgi:hypothetical protein
MANYCYLLSSILLVPFVIITMLAGLFELRDKKRRVRKEKKKNLIIDEAWLVFSLAMVRGWHAGTERY